MHPVPASAPTTGAAGAGMSPARLAVPGPRAQAFHRRQRDRVRQSLLYGRRADAPTHRRWA